MASTKKISAWLEDLRKGSAKKRESAARQLASAGSQAELDQARTILLAAVAQPGMTRASKRSLQKTLQWVVDDKIAIELLRDENVELDVSRLPASVFPELYRNVAQAIKRRKTPQADVEQWVTRLGALDPPARPAKPTEEEDEALLDLYLALIDDTRFATMCAAAARGVRRLDVQRGNEILLARWQQQSAGDKNGVSSALDAAVAWIRLGFPGSEQAERLSGALIAELGQREVFLEGAEARAIDKDLAKFAPEVPNKLARSLLAALERRARDLPKTAEAAAKRVASIARDEGFDSMIELLDDRRLSTCHAFVAAHLAQSGTAGARAVIERANRLSIDVLTSALVKLPAEDAWTLLAPTVAEGGWWQILPIAPAALRDERWIETIERAMTSINDRGRSVLVAMARDPQNNSRIDAIRLLDRIARRATDRMEKRHSLHALGTTGHPEATLPLVEALADPNVGDAAPLICTALGECGDTRAIGTLEKHLGGKHDGFLHQAINAIRERVNKLHADVLAAASKDNDPLIVDLAQRAQNGDIDAAIVLEDALRERGLL